MSDFDETFDKMLARRVLSAMHVGTGKAIDEIDFHRRRWAAAEKVLDEDTLNKIKAEMDYPTSEPDDA